jgi:biopolymer transport protein ExbD
MLNKKKRQDNTEINAGSMADIAFLLLIFFLVTTTIANEKGLLIELPPKREEDTKTEVKMKDHNVFKVLINARNQLLVEDEPMTLGVLRKSCKDFLSNKGKNKELSDSPQIAAVSYKTDRGTKYAIYLKVLNEIKAAYNELRSESMNITVKEYLAYNQENDLKDPKLEAKARKFAELSGKTYDPVNGVKDYLRFNPDEEKKKGPSAQKSLKAYAQVRNSGKAFFIEKYYDAAKEYPLRISEAEPTTIGGK